MLYFVRPKSMKAWICRLSGTLDPFVRKQAPSAGTQREIIADLGNLGQTDPRDRKPINLPRRFELKKGIIFKEEGEGAFLLELDTGNSKYMNRSARDLFLMLSEEKDVEKAIGHFLRWYPEADPKQIRKDVVSFINELERNGFIRLRQDTV